MSSGMAEQKSKEGELEEQESSRKRPHSSDRDDEGHGLSMENKQRRLDSEDEVQDAPSTKHEQSGDVAIDMEPVAPLLAPLPGLFEPPNPNHVATNTNVNQLGASPSVAESQTLPMSNPLFVGQMSMGAQMAVPPQIALTQQQSLTAQQALAAASSVSTQGRDASHEASSVAAPGDANGQQNALTVIPPQPQNQILQPQQQQGLPALPMGALPPGAPNPLQLQFLQRAPMPAQLSDADAAAFCNRMLLSGFPLAGGMAVPALFAQQINRQRPEGPILAIPTPRADGICLALACDDEQLSEYQILVRKQLEIFEALQEDVESNTQGRKKQVVLGQVGIRCRHCSGLPLRQRGRGAVYYPAKLQGVYQAAQNMASSHLCESCQYIPHPVKQDLRLLRERRDTASGGKQYWADGARAMGLYESEEGLKLRRGPLPSDKPVMLEI